MLIIRSGAKLDAEDAKGRRPVDSLPRPQSLIHFAASEGQVALMSQLLSSKGGCKVDEANNEGLTPLQIAAMKGDVETVKLLLQHGARPNIPAGKGKDGAGAGSSKTSAKQVQIGDRAAIHFAAEKGHGSIVTVLVAAGAKVNQPSECGMTALHLAVWHRHVDAIKALLQAKADVHARVKTNGMTPLHYAAFNSHGNRDIVSILLDKGSELEARTQEGWTPLHLASTVSSTTSQLHHISAPPHLSSTTSQLPNHTNSDLMFSHRLVPLKLSTSFCSEALESLQREGGARLPSNVPRGGLM